MPQHTHHWRVTRYILLGLPTPEGLSERLFTYACPCGLWQLVTGEIRLGQPLATPGFWDAVRNEEQRRRTPEARQAAHEQAAWEQRGRRVSALRPEGRSL